MACLAALRRHTDAVVAAGDTRTRGQIMADTLVERVTGQARAADVNVEVGIVLPVDALTRPRCGRGRRGHRATARSRPGSPDGLLADTRGQPLVAAAVHRTHRRSWSAPTPAAAAFDGVLAHLIRVRDGGRCRDPFCDAPIRHLDHIRPHRAGGPTSLANGRGVCARGNYVREMPGWRVELVARRPRPTSAHRPHHHPHRAHLRQPGGPGC